MNIFDLFGQLLGTIIRFIPRIWFCPAWMAGVLFVRGKHPREFGPGMVFWWPFLTSMLTCPTVRQVLEIRPQTITTKDGKTVIVAGVVTYRVKDVMVYLTENFEAETSVDEAVSSCLRDVIVDRTWEQVQNNNRNTIDRALTSTATELVSCYGIEIERVRITSMAPATVVNVVTDTRTTYLPQPSATSQVE